MEPTKWQSHNPDSELRSFVYQQIQELSEFAAELGAVMVTLEESTKGPKSYAATFVMSPLGLPLQARVVGENMYDALAEAKRAAKSTISATYSAIELPLDGEEGAGSNGSAAKH